MWKTLIILLQCQQVGYIRYLDTYHLPNTVADQVHPSIETLFLNCADLIQMNNATWHTSKWQVIDEHNNKFKVLTWIPMSQYLNSAKHLW